MAKRVTDITPDFFQFWERAEGRAPDEQQRLWYELYEAPHDDLLSLCGGRHGMPEALPAALARFPEIVPHLGDTASHIRVAIERTGAEIAALFDLERLDLHWVLLVGMFWSDGWVVEVDGHPTCFIAIEMIGSPLHAKLLLPHEAAHVAHAACLGDEWAALDTLGCDLFLEGLATLVSSRVVPGLGEKMYPWAGLERTRRGLSAEAWLADCETSWPAVRSRLLRDLAATDTKTIVPYILGDQAPPDLPERVGYFAGFRLVSALAQRYSIAEMARWPAERLQETMARALASCEELPPPLDRDALLPKCDRINPRSSGSRDV